MAAIRKGLDESLVVALLGARQVGKTTLAHQVMKVREGPSTLYDLETAAAREALSTAPKTLLRESRGLIVIDEVQRLPELFATLRPLCDDPKRQAQFLLLGSASLDLISGRVRIAGRAHPVC